MQAEPPSPQDFSVRLADWAADEDAIRRVRTEVFVEEQAVPALVNN